MISELSDHLIAVVYFLGKIMDYPIDLVYLWCDGADQNFIKRRNQFSHKLSLVEDTGERYEQIEELKFSLRSVHLFVPWINHIFIVTDRQIPAWLNLDHPKISIVDHSEILPQKIIPVFNSTAIETALFNIPGLSEHFLYANDDMFFRRPLKPDFFFDAKGNPIVRLKKVKNIQTNYYRTIRNAQNLIAEKFGQNFDHMSLHHNVDGYLKSVLEQCYQTFKNELDQTRKSRFRSPDDIQRIVYSFFHLVQKKGRMKNVKRSFWQKLCSKFYAARMDSFVLNQTLSNREKFNRLRKFNPALFCLNDACGIDNVQRLEGKIFLEQLFAEPSPFEKE